MRKTKIICTLGPATDSPEKLRALILAGANVFRLNMSHAPHDWVREVTKRIRAISAELGVITGILMDTQGPAIRTGDLPAKLNLTPGDIFEFTVRGEKSEDCHSVDVNYEGLVNDISVGDVVLVDNGVIHMKVLEKDHHRIRCEVLTQGVLGSRRHINLPGVKVNLPPLTEKDLKDIEVGVEVGVDYVALSFCREAADIEALKRVLAESGSQARAIAKIEDQHAVTVIDDIIRSADVVMVARGDLGIECPMEELPIIQRRIVKRCITLGRQVIVATHMLESMIENPLPTRAEITDVANAVFEQADAIMLSGETTVGKYPVECVQVFDRVSRRIERSGGAEFAEFAEINDVRQKAVKSAVALANSIPGSKIVVFTKRGYMADHFSQLRPAEAPIFAFTPSAHVARRLTLNWATLPIVMPFDLNPEYTIAEAEKVLLRLGLVEVGTQLVVLTDVMTGKDRFDSIQVRRVA
ncbi:pyruvate kinase [Terrimicrobium sacchariphilum]|jgi:pyruvate kinase|uniref:Pyruvate kinase n=1 Tax=Terrimicrobium sacchariphilum TaxID=690879 RepID=A0A146G912_TERSA|nr:pyruvate kinase [Terrimicrobium sacchariphilum]GAT33106.1 pyruvate kinase [Terrimicrobium sacchariphilum]